ncbi:MAG: cytidylate kinase family protein [Candidatus Micrarchaeota archaeon]|nr:cytidylate kinase family protein [Candidatus Micrarchaeota archaeon]
MQERSKQKEEQMIITISGLSGSGKNTIGSIVAKRLKLRHVNPTFKKLAEERRMDLLEFQKKAEAEPRIDKEFDAALIKEVEKGPCVVTTWLGPWMILNADLRVWIDASQQTRAQRIAKRDGMTLEKALEHISARDSSNRSRYLSIYNIDICDHSGFDLVINSEKFKPEQSAQVIINAALLKAGKPKKGRPALQKKVQRKAGKKVKGK